MIPSTRARVFNGPGIFHRRPGSDGSGRVAFGARRDRRSPLPAAGPAGLLLFPLVCRRRVVDGPADPLLHLPQGPAAFTQRVEMIFLIRDGVLALRLAFLIHQGDALGQAGAAIACHLLQVRQAPEFLGPGIAVAVVRQAAGQPA
jgi:hypothetical protein